MFVTAIYAELDEASGRRDFVNAGHCEPIITRADGHAEVLRRSGNPPLGVMEHKAFVELSFTLGEGEMLFLYTDGITEAFDRDGGLFNVQRLHGDRAEFGSALAKRADVGGDRRRRDLLGRNTSV